MDSKSKELGEILSDLLRDIKALQYGDSSTAELLYQRTKMLSNKFFPLSYSGDLVGLRFRVEYSYIETLDTVWNKNIQKLYAIAKAMHDDYYLSSSQKPKIITQTEIKHVEVESGTKINALTEKVNNLQSKLDLIAAKKSNLKKGILFWGLLILSSGLLWSFNLLISWKWLEIHPKKIAIYLGFQLLIVLLSVRILKKNRAIDIVTIITVVGIIISLL